MILTREQALKVSKRNYATVEVPELDGELRLASLTAGSALTFASLQARIDKGEDLTREIMLLLIESAIVDETGEPFFDPESAKQFLDRISPETISLITEAIPKPKPLAVPPGNSKASPAGA
jgi:hypothetical protein